MSPSDGIYGSRWEQAANENFISNKVKGSRFHQDTKMADEAMEVYSNYGAKNNLTGGLPSTKNQELTKSIRS